VAFFFCRKKQLAMHACRQAGDACAAIEPGMCLRHDERGDDGDANDSLATSAGRGWAADTCEKAVAC